MVVGHKALDLSVAALTGTGLLAAKALVQGTGTPDGVDLTQLPDLLSRAWREGGYFLLVLAILYFYRADFRKRQQEQATNTAALLSLISSSVTSNGAVVASVDKLEQTTERLARALEDRRPPSGRHVPAARG